MSIEQDNLVKTIKGLEAARDEHGPSIAKNATAIEELKTALAKERQEREALALAAREREHAPPDEVSRAYALTGVSPDDMRARGGVASIKDGDAVSPTARWAGTGAGVVRMLGGVERGGVFQYGILDDPNPKSEWQREAQAKAEQLNWVRAFKRRPSSALLNDFNEHMRKGPGIIGKVFADNAGEGGEWIVTLPMSLLERSAEMPRALEGQLNIINVDSSTVTMPFLTTGVQPFVHGVPISGDLNPTDLPKSVPTTSDRTINIKTLAVDVPVDRDAAEDSIVAAIPLMQQLVAEALRDGTEDCLINGDTAASHGDTGFASWNPRSRWQTVGSSVDHRKAWIGFRQRAYDVDGTVSTATTDFNGSQTVSAYIGALAGLSSPQAFGNVVYITSPEHYLAKIIIDTNLLTVDKYGQQATVISGEVGRIGGKPLVLSEFVTADLAATGLFTGSGALTGLIIANLSRFMMAKRRTLRIELETVVRHHVTYVVASERKTLHTLDGNAVANVRWLFNLSSS